MPLRKRFPKFPLGKRQDVDMTEGSIIRHIIAFALPLLVGNIFQQLYNMVDTWVVGNYVNIQAYSAVGTVGPIVNMLIGFFMGLSSGAGVVISQYYGAQQSEKVKQTVHTALLMTLALGVVFTVVGILMTPTMLKLINMPDAEAAEATVYLTIYFAGILGLMFYNIGAGILRAVGDSQRPFYFLVVSAVLNIVLDLVFVLCFNMGVAGVALATILSQGISAILIIITLLRSEACIKLIPKELKIHWDMLRKIFTVGIPAALQMAITAFSNIFVQSYINYFGGNCMAGWTTYAKVDQLLFLPMQSIALASTTFVGQNLGRNQLERAREGVAKSLMLALAFTAVLTVPVVIFARPIVTFFIKDSTTEALEYGTLFLQWLSPFYLLCCFNQIYSGALRGAGNTKAPMVIMLCSFVGFRQLYLFITAQVCNEILPIAMGYPAGWLVCSLITGIYYHKVQLTKTRLVEE